MPGATLSRWTLSYFAAAMLFLTAAEVLMTLGFGYPAAALQTPETLIVVHFITIGWLSLLMCGALFQFVPVLVAKPIYSNRLPLPALLLILAGLVPLTRSFLQLGGYLSFESHCYVLASVLLGSGFSLVLWNLGRTLWGARPLTLPARFVTAGLFCLAATVTFGIVFLLIFGGFVTVPFLLDLKAQGVPLHVIAGLGGWLTFTAMGVSHRLLAMFMLSPELDGAPTRWTLYLGTLALTIVIVGGTAAIGIGYGLNFVLIAACVTGLACLGLYGRDALQLYRKRVRRAIELNSRMASIALINFAVAVALTIACAAFGVLERYAGALVFLFTFGWLTGLGLAKLYKIIAFVTWLECYGPVLGKTPTPRVQDLVVETRAVKWFWLHFAAVAIGTLCLLAEASLPFRVAAAAMTVATAGIAFELLRTRRLVDVSDALRLPAGARKPRLLFTFVPG
jgi:hypothetical protein